MAPGAGGGAGGAPTIVDPAREGAGGPAEPGSGTATGGEPTSVAPEGAPLGSGTGASAGGTPTIVAPGGAGGTGGGRLPGSGTPRGTGGGNPTIVAPAGPSGPPGGGTAPDRGGGAPATVAPGAGGGGEPTMVAPPAGAVAGSGTAGGGRCGGRAPATVAPGAGAGGEPTMVPPLAPGCGGGGVPARVAPAAAGGIPTAVSGPGDLRTGNTCWHFGHRTLSPDVGMRVSSTSYSALQWRHDTRILGPARPGPRRRGAGGLRVLANGGVIVPPAVNSAPPQSDVLVLGAGLAGLSAALHLGGRYRLLERADRPGGLCRTDERGGFLFDATGHWLHLRDPGMRRLAEEALPGGWVEVRRRAGVFSHGVFTRYPYQVNTHGLPAAVIAENVLGFIDANLGEKGRPLREREPLSFGEFILRHLGEGFARNFMFPYNTKLFTLHPDELAAGPMERFVPRPTLGEVVRGALGLGGDDAGYNATFLYPRAGGIEAFARALSARLPRPAECGVRPLAVDPSRRVALLSSGEEVRYRAIVATIPLPDMARLVRGAPPDVLAAADALRASAVTYVNVAARDVGAPPFHWVYLPEERFRPYRVGSASAAVPSTAPGGCRSFWVEFGSRAPLAPADVEPSAVSTLVDLGFLRSPADVLFLETRSIPHAYVLCDRACAGARETVMRWLAERDVIVAGRYGAWEYSSMEDALLGGRAAARQVG